MNKPEYRVPLMSEIAQYPKNGYKVVSTFSGCGGSCLGFEMARYEILWANEFIQAARETYKANHPNVYLYGRDIRSATGEEILKTIGLKQGEVDVLEGSPPCADFSMSGKRKGGINTIEMKGWGRKKKYSDTTQQVDDLFFEFARILKELQPKVFVAENVKGLTIGHAANLLGTPQMNMLDDSHEDTIYFTLTNCGYNVRYKVLNAKNFGVPQSRDRLIFIGTRKDLNIEPIYPIPLNYIYSLSDAIPLENTTLPIELETDISRFAIGKLWETLKPGEGHEQRFNLVKPALDRPCPTIVQSVGCVSAASVVHPLEKRKFSTAELRRLSGFPDDFILTGSFQQQCERIGRAVPPVMMYHIAKTIKEEILDKCKTQ